MSLELPQRRQFPTRDDFAAAVSATFQDLYAQYESEPLCASAPDWAHGGDAFNIALPLKIAHEFAAPHGISSIIKHAIEMGKTTIGRIARVERDGFWIVYFEAK